MTLAQTIAKAETKRNRKFVDKLTNRHQAMLAPGETFTGAMKAVAADEPQPPIFLTVGIGGLVGYYAGRAWDRNKARDRAAQAQQQVGFPLSRLPKSKNGYVVSTTQSRMLVFDGRGKTFVSEASLVGMDLVVVDHGKKMSTFIFTNGSEGVALAHIRDAHVSADVFANGFHHRQAPQAPASAPVAYPAPPSAAPVAPAPTAVAPDPTPASPAVASVAPLAPTPASVAPAPVAPAPSAPPAPVAAVAPVASAPPAPVAPAPSAPPAPVAPALPAAVAPVASVLPAPVAPAPPAPAAPATSALPTPVASAAAWSEPMSSDALIAGMREELAVGAPGASTGPIEF